MADKAGKEGFGSQFFSGLFWKTFGALFILVLTSVCAWLYGLAVLNEAPRAQAASLPVSYTHLDVYKRQALWHVSQSVSRLSGESPPVRLLSR